MKLHGKYGELKDPGGDYVRFDALTPEQQELAVRVYCVDSPNAITREEIKKRFFAMRKYDVDGKRVLGPALFGGYLF